ncbi:MAG TPA: NADH-quinone oxidoreductase subunit NuoF [Clostridia bacterium]|nr:NADH-quinone oxidoreductase subunit NuoF [Clostridia bacterium]
MTKFRTHILVCGGTGCVASKSDVLVERLKSTLKGYKLEDEIQVVTTGCFGFCEQGPIVKVHPDNVFYVQVTPEDAEEIVTEHIIKGREVERLIYKEPNMEEKLLDHSNIPFYKKQLRIALKNCGLIDPENIEEYIAVDGYMALGRVLDEMTPQEVIRYIKKSNLRGRGGGGFPAGLKWETASRAKGVPKYIVCNADEGDPGAFMDRSILEGDPHTVLEAMTIAGYAVGANIGYIYIRAEYPLAVHRLKIALAQAEELGLLGEDIMGSGFSFQIELKYGAGAFVCGEETALLRSVEGERGEPTVKPPFPAISGLWGQPTIVNNVETLANICPIILNGTDWFNSIGTEKSNGTKVFALAGKINNVGLVEVPMGTTLRDIVEDIGGGIKDGKKLKAIQTGGPSGGCIPASALDTHIDYDTLTDIGSMMGSGGMIVLDEDDCMVNIAKFYLEFTVEESCGKCSPCRVGNKRLYEILQKITDGKGSRQDLRDLRELGEIIKDTSLCGLGQTAPNPVLSTLKYFWDEYEAHVVDHRCPAGVCTKLIQYKIIPELCIGCSACVRVCPVNCISGERRQPHLIDQSECIKCGACYERCPVDAIIKE